MAHLANLLARATSGHASELSLSTLNPPVAVHFSYSAELRDKRDHRPL